MVIFSLLGKFLIKKVFAPFRSYHHWKVNFKCYNFDIKFIRIDKPVPELDPGKMKTNPDFDPFLIFGPQKVTQNTSTQIFWYFNRINNLKCYKFDLNIFEIDEVV